MSNAHQHSTTDGPQKAGTALALILIWALTLVVTQAAIWSTARIFDHANVVENNLTWGQSALLSFIWIFTRIWHRGISDTGKQR